MLGVLSAKEIAEFYSPSDTDRLYVSKGVLESDEQVWKRKAEEAKTGTYEHRSLNRYTNHEPIYSSIALEGVKNPIYIGTDISKITGKCVVASGHHRVAVALSVNPAMPIDIIFINGGTNNALKLVGNHTI